MEHLTEIPNFPKGYYPESQFHESQFPEYPETHFPEEIFSRRNIIPNPHLPEGKLSRIPISRKGHCPESPLFQRNIVPNSYFPEGTLSRIPIFRGILFQIPISQKFSGNKKNIEYDVPFAIKLNLTLLGQSSLINRYY